MSLRASHRAVLEETGAVRLSGLALPLVTELEAQLADLTDLAGGSRIVGRPKLAQLLSPGSTLGDCASDLIGEQAHPVRAILFDKRADSNWALGWHQDRVIAVRAKAETPGFGPWSVKQGIAHAVAPPDLIARMVTLRVHLDLVDATNGPLEILAGSHRLGRLADDRIAQVANTHEHVACHADTGDVWAYSTKIVHRSASSQSESSRRVLHVDYSADTLPGALQWRGI